ncbi:MAG: glycosyltransferase [bacterium]
MKKTQNRKQAATGDWDIAIVARDVWSEVWRRRHFLANEWALRRRVLYVEPPVSVPRMLTNRLDKYQREMKSASNILKPPREVAENIFAVTPAKPFIDSAPGLREVNKAVFAETVRSAAAKIGLNNPVLWITPEYGVHVLNRVPHSLSVYDVTDDWTQAGIPYSQRRRIEADDRAMLKQADIVFTVSPRLLEIKRTIRPDAVLMPNGVATGLYDLATPPALPDELRAIQPPIIGYTGTLHEDRLDISLICELAVIGKNRFSLALVGPNYLPPSALVALHEHSNIHIIPAQPYHRLPAFLANFAVCMIPHALTPFTHSLDPIKAYEYLASGRPIVSTPVDGILPLMKYVALATAPAEFAARIESALAGNEVSDSTTRRAAARDHSWSKRAEDIESRINCALEKRNQH